MLYDIVNYRVMRDGLRRSPGAALFGAQGDVNDTPYVDIVVFWQTDGSQVPCLLTSRFFYTINAYSAPTATGWDYTTGTCNVSGVTVTAVGGGDSEDWDATNHCLGYDSTGATGCVSHNGRGDWIRFNGAGNWYEIEKISSGTALTLATSAGTISGATFEIRRCFHPDNVHLLDWTVCPDPDADPLEYQLYITDYERQPLVYDSGGDSFALHTQKDEDAGALDYVCGCMCYYGERLWIGNLIEDGSEYYQQRIRWSDVGDPQTFTSTSFIDLPYTSSEIMRIVPMGSLLVVYFVDCIYLGRASSDPNLPYVFFRVETGGVGLTGVRAVCEALNGNMFLGKDDVYFLSSEGLRPLNAPDELIEGCSQKNRVYLVIDPERNRLIVGTPISGGQMTDLWCYNFKTDAWSRDTAFGYTFLAAPIFQGDYSWNDLTDSGILSDDSWNVGMVDIPSWSSLSNPHEVRSVFAGDNSGYIHQFLDSSGTVNSTSVPQEIVTGDMDFNAPERDKAFTMVRMRLREIISQSIDFIVCSSDDSGESWKVLGALRILAGKREGKLNFRKIGSTMRFKFLTFTRTPEYTVVEISFRVAIRGEEVEIE